MPDKNIGGWLVVNWKNEDHRTRKNKPSAGELGTNELVAELAIDVTVPEVEVPTLAVEIDVPEPQVYAATLEAIDDEDLPDWSDVANHKVEAEAVAFEGAENAPEWESAVDRATVSTLRETPGRPDVENVREYVDRVARSMVDGDAADSDE
jgi:hypothetical protein